MRFDDGLARVLSSERQLVVRQQKNWGEILTGFEAVSRYEICEPSGAAVARVHERSDGLFATLGRWMFKGRRPFTLEIEANGAVALRLSRPWFWIWSSLEVTDGQGRALGRIEQRFGFRRRFELIDAGGVTRAWIVGPFFKPWTFIVHEGTDGGPEIGRVEKKWSGLMKEMFTDADNFLVTLPHGEALRALVLCSALLIDFCYFENESSEGGLLKMLTE